MRIKLSPQRRDDTLTILKSGNSLLLNGEQFDFSQMGEGDTLPRSAIACGWLVGDINNTDGELTLTLLLPIPANYSHEQAFPVDLLNVPDGPVVFPQPLPDPEPLPLSEAVIEIQTEGAV